MMNSVKGKNAVITGGTRGIGLAIAEALLERGAQVLLCARKQAEESPAARASGRYSVGCPVRFSARAIRSHPWT